MIVPDLPTLSLCQFGFWPPCHSYLCSLGFHCAEGLPNISDGQGIPGKYFVTDPVEVNWITTEPSITGSLSFILALSHFIHFIWLLYLSLSLYLNLLLFSKYILFELHSFIFLIVEDFSKTIENTISTNTCIPNTALPPPLPAPLSLWFPTSTPAITTISFQKRAILQKIAKHRTIRWGMNSPFRAGQDNPVRWKEAQRQAKASVISTPLPWVPQKYQVISSNL